MNETEIEKYRQFRKLLRRSKGYSVITGLTKYQLRMFHKMYKEWRQWEKESFAWLENI